MELATETARDVYENATPLDRLSNQVELLEEAIDTLTASHNRILALLESLESQFGPVMDGMKNGPIGKLMGL